MNTLKKGNLILAAFGLLSLIIITEVVLVNSTISYVRARVEETLVSEYERVDPASLPESETISIDLVNGWNLVALPVVSPELQTGLDLITDIARSGGYATTISYWDGDRWLEVSRRGEQVFGQDYELQVGKAYFIRNHISTSWEISGVPLTEEQKRLSLREGWNAVGVFKEFPNAESFIDQVNQGQETLTEVDRWYFGIWEPFVKRIYADQDIQTYGTNFNIDQTTGYMIKANDEVTF